MLFDIVATIIVKFYLSSPSPHQKAQMSMTFRNYTGALKLMSYPDSTIPGKQVPLHDVNYSSDLKNTAEKFFDKEKVKLNATDYEINIKATDRPNPIPIDPTMSEEVDLATAGRQASIYERSYKQYIRQPKIWDPPTKQNKVLPKQIAKMTEIIGNDFGGIPSVTNVKNPVIKTENNLLPRDTYFHGGNVFDGR